MSTRKQIERGRGEREEGERREKEREEGGREMGEQLGEVTRDKIHPSSDLLPPTKPHLLKFPSLPNSPLSCESTHKLIH
jgi:hypothetical protein